MDSRLPVYFCRPEEVPYGAFSQWYHSPFVVDGVTYQTAEMWMMVEKARLFGDTNIAHQMTQTTDPAEHQKLGRKAQGFNRQKWDEHKSRIVEEGNFYKFTQSENKDVLAKLLLDTGDRDIVESSPDDKIWGIGFSDADAEANRSRWGENRLGIVLMNVRRRIQNAK